MGLPGTIEPMLARAGPPFDSDDHLFEVKWDGLRAIVLVEGGACRIHNRRGTVVTERYPDLAGLAGLPDGTAADGEIVVLRDGRPDFQALQGRWNVRSSRRAAGLAREAPATFVGFDLLYDGHRPLLERPLVERRERLREVLDGIDGAAFSDGIVGPGKAYFEEVRRRGLEGVVAKRLDGRYLPGRRSDAWRKIKARRTLLCVILGYVPDGQGGFRSLIVGAPDENGELRCVGRVGSGIRDRDRERLDRRLRARPRAAPIVPARVRGSWVEPGLYCRVAYQERTRGGELRAPTFEGLVER